MPEQPRIPDVSKLMSQIGSFATARAMPEIRIPENPLVRNANSNLASEFHQRLVKWINDFDASLDDTHEVGVRLVSFGQTVVFHLDGLGYWNPSLISFSGHTEDGEPVELIQHVSQISVLLMKLPRKDPAQPKRKIGFQRDPRRKLRVVMNWTRQNETIDTRRDHVP